MGLDLSELKRNKPLQYATAAVAALGLAALYRRKSAAGGGATTATGGTVSPAAAQGGLATFNSTGSDVANYLGQQNQFMSNAVDAWTKQITDGIGKLQGNGGTVSPAVPPWANWKPEQPHGMSQFIQERNAVGVKVDPVKDATQYVFRLSRPDQPGTMTGAYFNTDPTFRFADLLPGVNYQISAQAITPGGLSQPTILQTWTGR